MGEQMGTVNVIEQVKSEQLSRRREAAKSLRGILLRADRPGPGDAKALPELVEILGLTLDDLANPKKDAEDAVQYAAMLAKEGENAQASRDLHKGLAGIDEWAADQHLAIDKEAEVKRSAIRSKIGPVNAERAAINQARQQAINVAARWISLRDGISRDEAIDQLRGLPPDQQLAAM